MSSPRQCIAVCNATLCFAMSCITLFGYAVQFNDSRTLVSQVSRKVGCHFSALQCNVCGTFGKSVAATACHVSKQAKIQICAAVKRY